MAQSRYSIPAPASNWPLIPPDHQPHQVTSVSPPPGADQVSGDPASVTDQWSPLSPDVNLHKIRSSTAPELVWCLAASQAINLYWIYHDNCEAPRWVNIKIYLPTTITRDFYHDR